MKNEELSTGHGIINLNKTIINIGKMSTQSTSKNEENKLQGSVTLTSKPGESDLRLETKKEILTPTEPVAIESKVKKNSDELTMNDTDFFPVYDLLYSQISICSDKDSPLEESEIKVICEKIEIGRAHV